MGYAFINFLEKNDVVEFFNLFHKKKWELFKSRKVILLFRYVKLNMLEYKESRN